MGRKTVRWSSIRTQPGSSSCSECNSTGMIQKYDWISGKTYYIYCDCYFGKQVQVKELKEAKERS